MCREYIFIAVLETCTSLPDISLPASEGVAVSVGKTTHN